MTSMNRPRGALLTTAALLAVVPALVVAPAHAEPPPNDGIRGAIPVALPSSTTTFDTTEATLDASDRRCVAGNSVWFSFTADATRTLRMTTAGSSFDTLMAIFTGPRKNLDLVDCDNNRGPGRSSADSFRIRQGQRYWVAVSTHKDTEGGGAGVLSIGRSRATATVVADAARSGGTSGRLFVSGTVSCSSTAEVSFQAEVSQRVGDNVARAETWTGSRQCGEEPVEWEIAFDSHTGYAFQPGPVSLTVTSRVWNGLARSRQTVTPPPLTAVDDPDASPVP